MTMNAKPMLEGQLVIGVDFDGTITTNPDMGKELELQPHVKRVLTWLKDNEVRLVLWTCRTGKALEEAMDFLESHDMLRLFEVINDQLPEINAKYSPNVARKLGADYYIDDKNLLCDIDWLKIEERLKSILQN
jgi:histidinol phosphatase-like enzyme